MEKLLHNHRGAMIVWRELLLAIIESRPDRTALVAHSLGVAQQMQDMLVNSQQPDAVIAGLEAEARFWRERSQSWSTPAPPSRP